MTTAYAISMICMALAVAIMGVRMSKHVKEQAVMRYLLFEELRLRADGATDEGVVQAWEWKPIEELGNGTSPKLMWFNGGEGRVSLAFTDGKEIWWTDDMIEPKTWALIHDGAEKVGIRVEFTEDAEPASAGGKINIGGEVPAGEEKVTNE